MQTEAIETRAQQILAETVGLSIPIDVVAVCRAQGVDLQEGTMPDSISGLVFKNGSAYTIYVNRAHSTVRRRYTVAHELGHVVLEHLTGAQSALQDQNEQLFMFRAAEEAGWPNEVEANRFAAALLMPRSAVVAAVEEAPKPIEASRLARRFWVSEAAMTIRLQTLFPQFALLH